MKNKVVLLITVFLVLSFSLALAGNTNRIGTAGAGELLIPVGSRGSSLGGAVLTSTSGVEAMYWNPAGLASLNGTQAMFAHMPYIADINVSFGGVATNVEGFGIIGIAAKIVSIGEIDVTTEDDPEGTGATYDPTLSVLSLTYAKILTAQVQFGATASFINENAANDISASGISFDIGFIYDPRWNGVKLGLAIKNFGPNMKYDGTGLERKYEEAGQRRVASSSQEFELPSYFNFGMSYDLVNEGPNFAMVSGNFRSNNFSQDMWQGGLEYIYDSKFSLRAGYNYADQDDYLYGFSFGAGLKFPVGESMISFEYSWTETDFFDDNQYFTFIFDF